MKKRLLPCLAVLFLLLTACGVGHVRHAIHVVAAAFSQAACTNKRNISVTAVIVDLF